MPYNVSSAYSPEIQIPMVMDLPVGNNLQDHVMADGVEFYTPYNGISITAAKAENFMQAWSYSLLGVGKTHVQSNSPLVRQRHIHCYPAEGVSNTKTKCSHTPNWKYVTKKCSDSILIKIHQTKVHTVWLIICTGIF